MMTLSSHLRGKTTIPILGQARFFLPLQFLEKMLSFHRLFSFCYSLLRDFTLPMDQKCTPKRGRGLSLVLKNLWQP